MVGLVWAEDGAELMTGCGSCPGVRTFFSANRSMIGHLQLHLMLNRGELAAVHWNQSFIINPLNKSD